MKKIITTAVSLAMVLSMGTVSVFAASPITTAGDSDSSDVKGTYVAGSKADTVYSVDITWGSMEFTYTAASTGTWNPETHTYDGSADAKWSETNNTVTVTNHSNAAIDAILKYTAESAYSAISGTFTEASGTANDAKLALATAAGTELVNAPSASAALNLSGALTAGVTNTKIGTVTVTITAKSGSSGSDFGNGGSFGRE